jgi:rhodanese-related sulfurtransferase
MHDNRSRLPLLSMLSCVFLVATPHIGDPLAATAQGWDTTKAAQGLIVLVGFTVALLVSLLLLARTVSGLRAGPRVSVTELKRRLDEHDDFLLLDVRTAADFIGEQGHIPGAHNIPLEELPPRIAELGDDPRRSIVLICRTDRRSVKAAAFLARRGFGDVRVVQGGMTEWLDNGWPVQESHPGPTEIRSN